MDDFRKLEAWENVAHSGRGRWLALTGAFKVQLSEGTRGKSNGLLVFL